MFLQTLMRRNPKLVRAAYKLHKDCRILPDSYVIDVDMLLQNARRIADEAMRCGVRLYYMTKQIGRNPYIAQKLEALGYDGCVAVDFKEAETMMKYGVKLGHVGHLVQIPKAAVNDIVNYAPEAITVYSAKKAKEISDAALQAHRIQNIMLRIVGERANIYAGQEAGCAVSELEELIKKIQTYKGVKLSGLTSFPCFIRRANAKRRTDEKHRRFDGSKNLYRIAIRHTDRTDEYAVRDERPNRTTDKRIGRYARRAGTRADGHDAV